MPPPGYRYTTDTDGRVTSIRGVDVPAGTIAVAGTAPVAPESREATQRSIELAAGIFNFAARANRPDPKPAAPPGG